MSFILVNPIVESNLIKSKKKSAVDAAEDLWSKFSTNIKNYTPEFYFSFMEAGSSKIHHYQVNETLENNKVKYSLKKYKNKNLNDKEFVKSISQHVEQDGGKHHKKHRYDDSSSSSDSDDEDLIYHSKKRIPRYGDPLAITYYPTIYGVKNIAIPPLIGTSIVLGGLTRNFITSTQLAYGSPAVVLGVP
jgi:hypothetical protein